MAFLRRIVDIFVAVLHLSLLMIITFLNGINHILFHAVEVVNIQIIVKPSGSVSDKLSYISKLCANNVDLAGGGTKMPTDAFDEMSFKPDSEYDDLDDLDDLDDFDDGDDNPPDDKPKK